MKTIELKVSSRAAKVFNNLDPKKRKQLEKSFENILEPKKTLEQIMKEMSEEAKRNGLTQEILDEILKDS
jgi:capsular polysaccharide biosynthesis protein